VSRNCRRSADLERVSKGAGCLRFSKSCRTSFCTLRGRRWSQTLFALLLSSLWRRPPQSFQGAVRWLPGASPPSDPEKKHFGRSIRCAPSGRLFDLRAQKSMRSLEAEWGFPSWKFCTSSRWTWLLKFGCSTAWFVQKLLECLVLVQFGVSPSRSSWPGRLRTGKRKCSNQSRKFSSFGRLFSWVGCRT